MSTIAAIGVYSREDDWMLALAVLLISYLVLYPSYLYYMRSKRTRRIKKQMVTSAYKLPVKLTPAEFTYVFSARISRRHLYATLLDLANRSVLVMHKKEGRVYVSIGPKIDNKLESFEKLLVGQVHVNKKAIGLDRLLEGFTNYGLSDAQKISGSKQYVFWWLLRYTLQKRKFIESKMTGRYAMMLFKFGVLGGLVVAVVPLFMIRLGQMIAEGAVEMHIMTDHIVSGLYIWVVALIPLLIVSFVLLRFSGWMLGRTWLLTPSFKHYLVQLETYREYVRLTHKNKLQFESKHLTKESLARTKPYAIALGYVKE